MLLKPGDVCTIYAKKVCTEPPGPGDKCKVTKTFQPGDLIESGMYIRHGESDEGWHVAYFLTQGREIQFGVEICRFEKIG